MDRVEDRGDEKKGGVAQAADDAIGNCQDDKCSVSRAGKQMQLGAAPVVACIGKGVD
jgi:hypothetical protein